MSLPQQPGKKYSPLDNESLVHQLSFLNRDLRYVLARIVEGPTRQNPTTWTYLCHRLRPVKASENVSGVKKWFILTTPRIEVRVSAKNIVGCVYPVRKSENVVVFDYPFKFKWLNTEAIQDDF